MTVVTLIRNGRWLAVTAGLAGAAVVVLAAVGFGGGSGDGTVTTLTGSGEPPATAEVQRGTLTQTQNVSGILSYGSPVGLIAQATSGVVTWAAEPGDVVGQGEAVYEVDGEPVVLLHGSVPPYRTLGIGTSGPDVEQLESNLADLGYDGVDGFTADATFDTATAAAVSAWQDEAGMVATGEVSPDQIAVAEEDIRIALQTLPVGSRLGAEPNQSVVTYQGTTRHVSVPLDPDKQQFVDEGTTGTVTLPDGTAVEGVVTTVDDVSQTIETGEEAEETGAEDFIGVEVAIEDQEALGTFNAAPVTLELVTGEKADVLFVPVNALVALAGGSGGYGLEVVEDGEVSNVPVETGMFAGGRVEVSGEGIDEGTTVGVAS